MEHFHFPFSKSNINLFHTIKGLVVFYVRHKSFLPLPLDYRVENHQDDINLIFDELLVDG